MKKLIITLLLAVSAFAVAAMADGPDPVPTCNPVIGCQNR